MNRNSLLVLFFATIILGRSHMHGQAVSGTSLSISGTGAINTLVSSTASITSGSIGSLVVGGTTDLLGNTLYFGSWTTDSSKPGWSLFYDDGTGGDNSSLTQMLTRPQAIWAWQRITASGSAANVMTIDASNRLILTGTDSSQQIVLDPNGANAFLTQASANTLYIPANAGLSILNGNVGIGTSSPQASLDVSGNAKVTGTMQLYSPVNNEAAIGFDPSSEEISIKGTKYGKAVYAIGAACGGVDIPGDGSATIYGDWYWQNQSVPMLNDFGHGGDGVIVIPFDGIYHFYLHGWSDYTPSVDTLVDVSVSINNQVALDYQTGFKYGYAQTELLGDPYVFFLSLKTGDRVSVKVGNLSANGQGWTQKCRIELYCVTPLSPIYGAGDTQNNPMFQWFLGDDQYAFASAMNKTKIQWASVDSNTVLMDGSVGINTTSPAAQFHVAGSGRFDGPVRLEPQGDLDMGDFTTEPSASNSQSLQNLSARPVMTAVMGVSGTNQVMTSGTRF